MLMNIKDTENIIKASERKNRSPKKEKKIGIRFLSNHNDTKRQQNNILYTKREELSIKILYPDKLPFKFKSIMKISSSVKDVRWLLYKDLSRKQAWRK